MIHSRRHSIVVLFLVIFALVIFAGCNKKPVEELGTPEASEALDTLSVPGFANPLNVPTGPSESPTKLEAYSEMAIEKHNINSDTVGWLAIPNTTINDVIMWYPDDFNEFYLRKNFEKRYSWEGIYFADFRSKWDGGRDGIPTNTVIYGHSMEDSPQGPLFSQLKKFLDEDFARKNPYIYFSTVDEDMVFEVFAAYYSDIYTPYNTPYPEVAAYEAILKTAREGSIYNYDVEVSTSDKIITLSTCCYNITPTYPNDYRYVLMGKLVDRNSVLKEEATITRNPSPKMPK